MKYYVYIRDHYKGNELYLQPISFVKLSKAKEWFEIHGYSGYIKNSNDKIVKRYK